MADTSLHLPIDWQRKAAVVKLGMRLAAWADKPVSAAYLYFVCMWTEWASNPEEWRPLNRQVSDLTSHCWQKEDLTFIIADACAWGGNPERLIVAAIEAGVYEVRQRADISGLVLVGWCEMNGHLLPGYESMQTKGGKATRMVTQRKEAVNMAGQQLAIFQGGQEQMLLNAQTQSAEEQKAALTLVIQIDRHCGLAVRATKLYSETVLRDAVGIIRRHAQGNMERVFGYLSANRDNPAVVKLPDRVLECFDDYLRAADAEAAP